MSTPTPRTDRQVVVLLGKTWIASYYEMHEHARTLERELAAEREKVKTLGSALQSLVNEQNGAPLERRRGHWQMAMDEAGLALATAADALI